jgi:NADH:ubiquinone oxidoreductase subunit C
MENNTELMELITKVIPYGTVNQGSQYPEIIVPADKLHEAAEQLRNFEGQPFDYLISMTAADFNDKFTVYYHMESTKAHNLVVLKADIADRDKAEVETVADIWVTAEFFEREVFDLFGIRFKNHPDLRRLFLEDDYGFPLRKDFKDEVNIIELPN